MKWKNLPGLCKVGIHDWEDTYRTSESTLKQKIKQEMSNEEHTIPYSVYGDETYAERVCLRCGKQVDEITPKENKIRENYYRKENRRKRID